MDPTLQAHGIGQSFIMTRIYSDPHYLPHLAELNWYEQTLDSNKS